jgi:hypothetical protein
MHVCICVFRCIGKDECSVGDGELSEPSNIFMYVFLLYIYIYVCIYIYIYHKLRYVCVYACELFKRSDTDESGGVDDDFVGRHKFPRGAKIV